MKKKKKKKKKQQFQSVHFDHLKVETIRLAGARGKLDPVPA